MKMGFLVKSLKKYIQFSSFDRYLIILPFLLLFIFGCFFPIIWSAFKIKSLHYLLEVFKDQGLYLSLKISVFMAFISTFLVYFFSYVLANTLFFTNSKFYKSLLTFSLLLFMAIPSYSLIVIYRSIIEGLGGQSIFSKLFFVDTDLATNQNVAIISVIFMLSVSMIPFTTFLIYSSLKNVKKGIIEMGEMDGLNNGGQLWHILLPITFPAISMYAVFNFLKSLKNFQIPFLMTSGYPAMSKGVFSTSIIGATTNLGVFLFNKLNDVYNVSIIASYTLAISLIVLLFSFVWYLKTWNKFKRVLAVFLIVFCLHLISKDFIPLIFYSLSLLYFYKHSRKFKMLYLIALLVDFLSFVFISTYQGIYNDFLLPFFLSSILIIHIGLPDLSANMKIYRSWSIIKLLISSLWIVFAILPILALFQLSFSYNNFPPFILPFHFNGFGNFISIFVQDGFISNLFNTFIIASFASFINIALTFPVVVAIRQMSFMRSFIYSVSIFFGIFTGIHTIIPIYKFFAHFSIFNTYIPIILMSAIHSMPMTFLILFAFLSKYDRAYDEIAFLEGASTYDMILKIYFPLSKDPIFVSFLYTFLQAWNSFILPLFLINRDSMYPVSIKLYNYVGEITSTYPKWNLFGAGALSNLLIVGIIFYIIQRKTTGVNYENFY